jgi:hypothetical protein
MPSDDRASPPPVERDGDGLLAWLRSQELGIFCGFTTVALLAVGSIVLPMNAGGASSGIALDDVRPFFTRPALAHLWFYLLCAVLAVYALSTALATWHSVTRRWRAGVRSPSAYAPAILHVSFLVALVAHGVGGFFGRDDGRVLIGPTPVALPDGRRARTVSLAIDTLPSGMPRAVTAVLELTPAAGGAAERATLGYDEPLSRGLGTDLLLLEDQELTPVAARLASTEGECRVAVGEVCSLGELRVLLWDVQEPRRGPGAPLARLVEVKSGQEQWVAPGGVARFEGGAPVRLVEVEQSPVVVVRARHAPGNPWALGAAVLMAAGIVLMGRRLTSS